MCVLYINRHTQLVISFHAQFSHFPSHPNARSCMPNVCVCSCFRSFGLVTHPFIKRRNKEENKISAANGWNGLRFCSTVQHLRYVRRFFSNFASGLRSLSLTQTTEKIDFDWKTTAKYFGYGKEKTSRQFPRRLSPSSSFLNWFHSMWLWTFNGFYLLALTKEITKKQHTPSMKSMRS